jgi:nucleoid-associated protein YgaU
VTSLGAAVGLGAFLIRTPPHEAASPQATSGATAPAVQAASALTSQTAPPKPAVAPTPNLTAADLRPSFDVVRIEPTGDAVIAGHGQPNSAVELRDDGRVVATAKADVSGQFVILPSAFSHGRHQIELAGRSTDGSPALLSKPVEIEVAVVEPPVSPSSPTKNEDIGISAPIGAPRTTPLVTSDASVLVAPLGEGGRKTAKVVRGDSLWSISTHFFGDGERYRQIHAANVSQIRNPRLIYPGQVLVVPQTASTH